MAHEQLQKKLTQQREAVDQIDGIVDQQVGSKRVDAIFNGVTAYQAKVKNSSASEELKETQLKRLLDLFQDVDQADEVEALNSRLARTLERFTANIDAWETWTKGKYEVKRGDSLSKIIEKTTGQKWEEDPKRHFAIVKKLQEQREKEGTMPVIKEDGSFETQTTNKSPQDLDLGEYLAIDKALDVQPALEAVKWYAQKDPRFEAPLKKIADELQLKEEMLKEGTLTDEDDIKDADVAEGTVEVTKMDDLLAYAAAYSTRGESVNLSENFEENFEPDYGKHGYVSVFELALRLADDTDAPFSGEGEREKAALGAIRGACQANLLAFEQKLAEATPAEQETEAYKQAERIYLGEAKRFVELSASVDEEYENSDARNIEQSLIIVNQMMPHMNLEESITWVTEISAAIDNNDYQSEELKMDYMKLYAGIKSHLKRKLDLEKMTGDPTVYRAHCLTLARLFSDQSGPIDSDQCDSAWASELAREAADMNAIVLQIAQNGTDLIKDQVDMFEVIQEERSSALEWLKQKKAAGLEVSGAIQVLERPLDSIENFAAMQTIIFQTQYLRDGEQLPPDSELEDTVLGLLTPVFESATAYFENYLKDTFWQKTPEVVREELDITLSDQQVEALNLFNDIEGNGAFDLSDKTWSYVALGGKIAATIVIGVGAGIATGGLGLVGAALVGGATLTASSAVIFQKGHEDGAEGFVDAYGAEFALNTATMGAARYLAAGRTVYQLNRAGVITGGLRSAEGRAILSLAGQKGGMPVLASLTEGMPLGTRLMGAGLEGTADVLLGASLDTAMIGGNFVENLQQNAMFFGVGFGMEFGLPPVSRFVKGAEVTDDASLAGLKGLNQRGQVFRKNLQREAEALGVDAMTLKSELKDGSALSKYQSSEAIPLLASEFTALRTGYKEQISRVLKLGELRELSPVKVEGADELSAFREAEIEAMEPKAAGEARVALANDLKRVDEISGKVTRGEALSEEDFGQLRRMAESSEFRDIQLGLYQKAKDGNQGALAELLAGLRGEQTANIGALRAREHSVNWGKVYQDSVESLKGMKDSVFQTLGSLWESVLLYFKRNPNADFELSPPVSSRMERLKGTLTEWGDQLKTMTDALPTVKDLTARLDLQDRIERMRAFVNQVRYNKGLLEFEHANNNRTALARYEQFLDRSSRPGEVSTMSLEELQVLQQTLTQMPDEFALRLARYEACPAGHQQKALLSEKVALMRKALTDLPALREEVAARVKKLRSDATALLDAQLTRPIISLGGDETIALPQLRFTEASGKRFIFERIDNGIVFAELDQATSRARPGGETRLYCTLRELLDSGIVNPEALTAGQRRALFALGIDVNAMHAHTAIRDRARRADVAHNVSEQQTVKPRHNPRKLKFDELPRQTAVHAIPDIHGDMIALHQSLRTSGLIDARGDWTGRNERVVFTGDYIDRGPRSLDVLDYSMRLREQAARAGGQVDLLIGNHEAMMLAGLLGDEAMLGSWMRAGGGDVLTEVRRLGHATNGGQAVEWMRQQFLDPQGKYHVLLQEWKPFAQVDDVLYVHAGINPDWAKRLADEGVEAANAQWQTAIKNAQAGDWALFQEFNAIGSSRMHGGAQYGGPLWMDFDQDTLRLTDAQVATIAGHLKSLGINAVVVGHTPLDTQSMAQNFLRYGIMVVANDVGMSAHYAADGMSHQGGLSITTEGSMVGLNSTNAQSTLYVPSSEAAAAK